MSSQHILVAFDFDHTLVDENTDYYIIKLAPGQELPEEISSLNSDNNWIDYMNEVFRFLHLEGKTREDILHCMSEIPFTEGMTELLKWKKENLQIDFVIISDSNSVFINHILDFANFSKSILQVFTNSAQFDADGRLSVSGYHFQDTCPLSSENLCKGAILKNFLLERKKSSIEYSSICYVGDGSNDLCPGLVLKENDFLMPRIGFRLHSIIGRMDEKNKPVRRSDLKAGVVPWSTGFDIIKHIENWIQRL